MVLICIGSVFAPIYSTLSTSSAKIVLICNCHCYPLFFVFLVVFVYPVIFVFPVFFVYPVFFVHCTIWAHCVFSWTASPSSYLPCRTELCSEESRNVSETISFFTPNDLKFRNISEAFLSPTGEEILFYMYKGVCILLWSIARSHILMVIQSRRWRRKGRLYCPRSFLRLATKDMEVGQQVQDQKPGASKYSPSSS